MTRKQQQLRWLLPVLIAASAAGQLFAQQPNFHRWTFDVGGGITPTLASTSNELGTGWNFVGGGGYNLNSHLGAEIQVMYDGLGVNPSVLKEFSVPGANAHIWGFTLDPRIRFKTNHRIGYYFIGGGGYYRRVVNFTRPTTSLVDIFNPFFGIIEPVLVPSNQVIGTITRVGWGWNIGGGITYPIGTSGADFFTEIRYHHIATSPRPTDILPITFGIRW